MFILPTAIATAIAHEPRAQATGKLAIECAWGTWFIGEITDTNDILLIGAYDFHGRPLPADKIRDRLTTWEAAGTPLFEQTTEQTLGIATTPAA